MLLPNHRPLHSILFPNDGAETYALIDGASCETLLPQLDQSEPEHTCLYAGELAPDLEEVAPYLIHLRPHHPFTQWLLEHCPGRNWGIFARSQSSLRALRKHFRTFLLVKNPAGKTLYFRYYDPRVLRIFLPTCDSSELTNIFGPVSRYILEGPDRQPEAFERRDGRLHSPRLHHV